jgi:hypothetical protein
MHANGIFNKELMPANKNLIYGTRRPYQSICLLASATIPKLSLTPNKIFSETRPRANLVKHHIHTKLELVDKKSE